MKIRVPLCLFVILVMTNFAAFAHKNDADFRECAAIDEEADRLGCYDRLMGRGVQSGSEDAAESARTKPGPSDSVSDATESTGILASASGAAMHKNGSGSDTVAGNSDEEKARAEPPDEFVAIVTAVSERALGRHVVSLNNGQVWQEEFASNYFAVDVGDTVTVRKRFFGGHRLIAESGKGYNVEKVR